MALFTANQFAATGAIPLPVFCSAYQSMGESRSTRSVRQMDADAFQVDLLDPKTPFSTFVPHLAVGWRSSLTFSTAD